MKGIADTGFLVAFLNRRDRFHPWAVEIAAHVDVPLLTCEAVLAESAYHVRSSQRVLALLTSGLITLGFDLAASLSKVEALARGYADRTPDLADLYLICMSEDFPNHDVVTVDSDFLVYRRWQHEMIPTRMPPAD